MGGTDHIENQIAEALAQRIELAIRAKARWEDPAYKTADTNLPDGVFRVVLLIPNFPEGAVTDNAVQAVLHYTLMTLNGIDVPETQLTTDSAGLKLQPVGSLIKRVQRYCLEHLKSADRWVEFITVNCLRNHAVIDGIPVMNQIYVHSKLMIVDDRVCICGSANINERSMLGDRDSEVVYRIMPASGDGDITIQMNGKEHTATTFGHSLRRSLWAEHLGLEDALSGKPCQWIDDEIGDPCCQKNFNNWRQIASHNTSLCNKYFLEQPANHHTTLKMYKYCRDIADLELQGSHKRKEEISEFSKYQDKAISKGKGTLKGNLKISVAKKQHRIESLNQFRGHLYEYPLFFLNNDLLAGNLKPSLTSAEGVIPAKTFT